MNSPNNSSAPLWLDLAAEEAWEKAQRIIRDEQLSRSMAKYRHDPLGFGTEVLGERYYDDLIRVMESVRDNRVTIARSANAVGKSFTAARIAIWFYKVYTDSQIYITAAPPLDNLKRVLWGQVASIVNNHSHLFSTDKVKSLEIRRGPRSFITGVAIPTSGSSSEREAKFSGKHAPHLMFIVDEGDAVPDEVYQGIESCMSGQFDRLLIMFNPRDTAGPVYYKEYTGQANVVELSAMRHPNVLSGKDVFPGAVSRDTTLRRINMWTRPLAPEEIEQQDAKTWHVPEFLVGETTTGPDGVDFEPLPSVPRKIENPAFSYMVLGEYPSQAENQLIDFSWVQAARTRYDAYVLHYGERPPQGIRPILGLDVSELGVDSNVACFRYEGFVAPFVAWKGIDPDSTAVKALEMYRERNCYMAMVDGTGVGSSVAPAMSRMSRMDADPAVCVSVKIAGKPSRHITTELGEFKSLYDQLWWALREWLRTDPNAMLPDDRMLLQELRIPMYQVKPTDGKIWVTRKDEMREALRRSPDRADALCLTFLPRNRATVMRLVGN